LPELLPRTPHRDDLGVGGGIVADIHLIVALADDRAVQHNHAADRIGPRRAVSLAGECHGAAHESGITGWIGRHRNLLLAHGVSLHSTVT
jgi:hypothetical protein